MAYKWWLLTTYKSWDDPPSGVKITMIHRHKRENMFGSLFPVCIFHKQIEGEVFMFDNATWGAQVVWKVLYTCSFRFYKVGPVTRFK